MALPYIIVKEVAKRGVKKMAEKKLKKSQKKRATKTAKDNAKARPKQDYAKKPAKKMSGKKQTAISAGLLAGATGMAANEIRKQNKALDKKYKKK